MATARNAQEMLDKVRAATPEAQRIHSQNAKEERQAAYSYRTGARRSVWNADRKSARSRANSLTSMHRRADTLLGEGMAGLREAGARGAAENATGHAAASAQLGQGLAALGAAEGGTPASLQLSLNNAYAGNRQALEETGRREGAAMELAAQNTKRAATADVAARRAGDIGQRLSGLQGVTDNYYGMLQTARDKLAENKAQLLYRQMEAERAAKDEAEDKARAEAEAAAEAAAALAERAARARGRGGRGYGGSGYGASGGGGHTVDDVHMSPFERAQAELRGGYQSPYEKAQAELRERESARKGSASGRGANRAAEPFDPNG